MRIKALDSLLSGRCDVRASTGGARPRPLKSGLQQNSTDDLPCQIATFPSLEALWESAWMAVLAGSSPCGRASEGGHSLEARSGRILRTL